MHPVEGAARTSEHFANANKHFAEHGIEVGKPAINVATMLKRKDKVVGTLVDGVSFLMKKNKVEVLTGVGALKAAGVVTVTGQDGKAVEHTAKNVVLALGSVPIELPFLRYDGVNVVSSDQAIAFDRCPRSCSWSAAA